MLSHRFWFSLLSLCATLPLLAQCPAQVDIRKAMADSSFLPEVYTQQLHEKCPTAADSLGPAFYARSLYYNGLDDREVAITYGKYALVQLQQADTTLQLGKMTYNLGLFHLWIGDVREANWYFREASKVFPLIDHPQSPRRWLQSLEDLGYTYSLLGDYQRSEETLGYARQEAIKLGNKGKVAHISLKLGEQYEKSGDLGAAAGALKVAVAGFTELEDVNWLGVSRISRATLLRRLDEKDSAFREIKDVLSQPKDLSDYNLARAYSLGLLLALDTDDLRTAEAYFSENLVVAQRAGDRQLEAQAWDNGGEASLKAANYPLAIVRFAQSISLLAPGFRYTEETPVPTVGQLAASPYNVNLLTYLGDLARAFRAAGQPEDALAALRAADRAADQLRDGLGGEQSALFWRGKALPVYEQAIELCYQLNQPEEAFYFFEKSRGILLLEGLAEADLLGRLPREAASTLAKSQQALLTVQRALLADDGSAIDSLQQALAAARENQLNLREELQQNHPGVMPVGRVPEVVELAAAQANLVDAGLGRQLQYFWGREHVYLLVLSPEEVSVRALGRVAAIEPQVRTLLEYFAGAKTIDNDPEGYQQVAHQVYETFFAPASAPENEAVLVLPDGLLGYVPFAALTTSAKGGYLLEQNPISYAQSSSVFARKSVVETANALAFTPFVTALANQPEAPLPFSAEEAEKLSGRYATQALSGAAASREALLGNAGQYGILHLGTHAYATHSEGEPARILTATDPLYLPDVYGLQLEGALVTLSACQSNIGPLAIGEGVLGFGRAFRAAGAGGVVASLWSLNDRAAADITASFYEHLAAGQPKPLALHQAQMDYLRRDDLPGYLKSPYYWAPLIYYGDAEALPVQSNKYVWEVIVTLVLISIAGWFSLRKS